MNPEPSPWQQIGVPTDDVLWHGQGVVPKGVTKYELLSYGPFSIFFFIFLAVTLSSGSGGAAVPFLTVFVLFAGINYVNIGSWRKRMRGTQYLLTKRDAIVQWPNGQTWQTPRLGPHQQVTGVSSGCVTVAWTTATPPGGRRSFGSRSGRISTSQALSNPMVATNQRISRWIVFFNVPDTAEFRAACNAPLPTEPAAPAPAVADAVLPVAPTPAAPSLPLTAPAQDSTSEADTTSPVIPVSDAALTFGGLIADAHLAEPGTDQTVTEKKSRWRPFGR